MKTEKQKMPAGELYHPDAELGAGSVVTRDIAQSVTVMGNPARRQPK